jgi:hypothetical protein
VWRAARVGARGIGRRRWHSRAGAYGHSRLAVDPRERDAALINQRTLLLAHTEAILINAAATACLCQISIGDHALESFIEQVVADHMTRNVRR